MQMISAASSSLLAAEYIGLFEHLGRPFISHEARSTPAGHDRRNFVSEG